MKGDIQAVIFDLDGTLIDSEPNYFKADQAIAHELGLEFTIETHHQFIGIGSQRYVDWLLKESGTTRTKADLLARKDALYLQFARENTKVFPEMRRLVEKLADMKINMSVATGSTREIMHEMLAVSGLKACFSAVVSTQDVKNGKPAPDVFLAAADLLSTRPEHCLVLEDSNYGIEAAISAGMQVAGIPSVPDKRGGVFDKCDILYKEGQGVFTAESILSYIEKRRPGTSSS